MFCMGAVRLCDKVEVNCADKVIASVAFLKSVSEYQNSFPAFSFKEKHPRLRATLNSALVHYGMEK